MDPLVPSDITVPNVRTIRILLLSERMGYKAIDISSPEQYQRVALAIVNARWEMGFYPEPIEPTPPEMTYHQSKRITPGKVRNFALGLWSTYREAYKQWQKLHEAWEQIKVCIDNQDGGTAVIILNNRRHIQGEKFEILELEDSY